MNSQENSHLRLVEECRRSIKKLQLAIAYGYLGWDPSVLALFGTLSDTRNELSRFLLGQNSSTPSDTSLKP
jgi:hypothetical protein